MSQPEPIRGGHGCDLCGIDDAHVIEEVSPPYPDDRRRERYRWHHAPCVEMKRAAEREKAARDLAARRHERRQNDA